MGRIVNPKYRGGLEFNPDRFVQVAEEHSSVEMDGKWSGHVAEVIDEEGDLIGTLIFIPAISAERALCG